MRGLVALAVLTIACSDALAPFTLTAQYRVWWEELEACSGLSGDFDAVRFYVLPDRSSFTVDGKTYWGYWSPQGNTITLAERWAMTEKLVKHEEMHALLQDTSHPAAYFNGACGDLSYPDSERKLRGDS